MGPAGPVDWVDPVNVLTGRLCDADMWAPPLNLLIKHFIKLKSMTDGPCFDPVDKSILIGQLLTKPTGPTCNTLWLE